MRQFEDQGQAGQRGLHGGPGHRRCGHHGEGPDGRPRPKVRPGQAEEGSQQGARAQGGREQAAGGPALQAHGRHQRLQAAEGEQQSEGSLPKEGVVGDVLAVPGTVGGLETDKPQGPKATTMAGAVIAPVVRR